MGSSFSHLHLPCEPPLPSLPVCSSSGSLCASCDPTPCRESQRSFGQTRVPVRVRVWLLLNKGGQGLISGFPWGSAGKESACNIGDPGSIPGSGRSPGEGNDYPLQYLFFFHCSILAWRIPWTEKPGGLQSMGLKRVRHD